MSKAAQELERAIFIDAKKTGLFGKIKFWTGKSSAGSEFAGADEPTPSLDKAMSGVPIYERLTDSEARVLLAIAGHLTWGEPAPELSPSDRKNILKKIQRNEPLTATEQLWINTGRFDSDMF